MYTDYFNECKIMFYFDIGDKHFTTALEMSGPYDCQSS